MGLVAYFLWRLRDRVQPGVLFAIYLVFAGTERLLVEFIRRNTPEFLGLTQPQLISVGMMIAGGVWLVVKARRGELLKVAPAGYSGRGDPNNRVDQREARHRERDPQPRRVLVMRLGMRSVAPR